MRITKLTYSRLKRIPNLRTDFTGNINTLVVTVDVIGKLSRDAIGRLSVTPSTSHNYDDSWIQTISLRKHILCFIQNGLEKSFDSKRFVAFFLCVCIALYFLLFSLHWIQEY